MYIHAYKYVFSVYLNFLPIKGNNCNCLIVCYFPWFQIQDHADEINGINKKYIERDKKYMKLIQEKNEELQKLKENFEVWSKETDSWLLSNSHFNSK